MNIDLQARDLRLTAGLDAAVRRAGPMSNRLLRIAVRVYDLKRSQAGLDKGCLVVADLVDGRVVVSSDIDQDLDRAIDRAFAKLGYSVANAAAGRAASPMSAARGSALAGVDTRQRNGPVRHRTAGIRSN